MVATPLGAAFPSIEGGSRARGGRAGRGAEPGAEEEEEEEDGVGGSASHAGRGSVAELGRGNCVPPARRLVYPEANHEP